MGVYHVSGLGLSPGALTVPMTAVYLLHAAAETGHEGAEEFFALSGKLDSDYIPYPQVIIAFTSEEAINGGKELKYKSKWFTESSEKTEPISKPIAKYLGKLIEYLNEKFGIKFKKPEFYLVSVDYQSFEDAYYKIGVTFNGLRDKEVWVNLIGGSNQINISMFLAGAYTAVPTRYYYLFQNDITRLEPEWIEKPNSVATLHTCADEILSQWYRCSFPPFNLGIGMILRELYLLLQKRERVSEEEIVSILEKRGFDKMHIRKLIGSGYLMPREKSFVKGPALDHIIGIWTRINQEEVDNFSKWKKWAEEKEILHEVEI